jgi:asparagine synthase (glutamine-hydrolysing)
MCGICGIVVLDRPGDEAAVRAMTAALAHRGPDGERVYAGDGVALGFRRLAILDLSEAGMQPFVGGDGRYRLVHNGEIYNYRELRAELEPRGHTFRTGTDTEVLLAAFVEWGPACVERFNGMWAFAIWDTERKQLFASRDRFGIKPLYYRLDGGRFSFASELKAFAAAGGPLSANPVAVREYLEQGHLEHGEETFFAEVHRLPPAHNLWFDRDGLRLQRHWRLEPKERPTDAIETVRELFLDSIRLRLRSDVPIGTCLSGGIDSSGIACGVDHVLRAGAEGAEQVGAHQRTFTAYFPERGFDERPFAQAVVQQIGAEPHWVTFTAEDFVDHLPSIVESQEEPFGSTSIVAQWYVMRAAREAGLTVMLDGQGGDELFAGYSGYAGYYFADLLSHGRITRLGREMRGFRRAHGKRAAPELVRPFLSESAKLRLRGRLRGGTVLLHRDLSATRPLLVQQGSRFPDRLRRQLEHILSERGLRELLRYEDRNSMAHSLEARLPFLDYRFVELVFSLSGGELIHNGTTKWILRRALGDLLPDVVRNRTDKLGFVTPEKRWFRGPLGDFAADIFASQSFAQRGFVDAVAARDRLARHRRGETSAGWELWRALNLELWARRFLDRPEGS